MSVKRYEWVACDEHSCHCDVVESVDGDMVDYEDYAALEARCAALAAELSAVEVIHNEAVFITDEHYEKCPPEVQKMIRSLAVMQIPAYQAFLAEVRASALPVEIAEIIDSGDLEAILFATEYPEAERYRMALYNFRTSRKGVQS